MGDEKMNKKGSLVLRDIMFMLIIFSSIITLAGLVVFNMADEYSNTQMTTDYNANGSIGNLGESVYTNINSSVGDFTSSTQDSIGSWNIVTGAIQGIGSVLLGVLKAPVYIKTALTALMIALKIPSIIALIVGNLIMVSIYIVIIFVIMTALTRGGTKV